MALPAYMLRPRATGFDPRVISGCICNLDASVLSSLFQNSDGTTAATATDNPVGYWGDLSGLGNHAKQTVATGSRPFLKLNNQNGRPGLLFDGSNDFLTTTISGFQSLAGVTVVQVVKTAAAAAADTNTAIFWSFGNTGASSSPYPQERAINLAFSTIVFAGEYIAFAVDKSAVGRLGSTSYRRAANTVQMLSATLGSAGTALFVDGSFVSMDRASGVTTSTASGPADTGYTVDDDLHLAALRNAGTLFYTPEMTIHQMLVYNRTLTAAELTTIWNAMRGKWGIT